MLELHVPTIDDIYPRQSFDVFFNTFWKYIYVEGRIIWNDEVQ